VQEKFGDDLKEFVEKRWKNENKENN